MISTQDAIGLPMTAQNQAAIEACLSGIDGYNRWRLDAMSHLDAAIAHDETFALPYIAKGWILHLGRSAAFTGKVRELISKAQQYIPDNCQHQQRLLESLRRAHAGDGIEAATILEANIHQYPTDLLSHRLVQFELFWNGRAAWMQDIIESAAPHWCEDTPGYGDFLSCRAFSNEEAGAHDAAEQYGRAAVERRESDPWGAHAVAHVLVMQGRVDDGVTWLESLCDNWADANQIKHHLWWHLCLFLLERQEHERIDELLTTQIRNPDSPLVRAVPDATIDLQNVSSLLLRLELRGVDVGEHWQVLAGICAARVHDHANAFTSAHDMMVLAATGQLDAAAELLRSTREYASSGSTTSTISYAAAGVAVCEAVLAHRQHDYAQVINSLSPVRHDLALIGGSHAQRDVFYQLLIDAAAKLGKIELVATYLRDVKRIGFAAPDKRTLYRTVA